MRISLVFVVCLALGACAAMPDRAPGDRGDPATDAWHEAVTTWRRGDEDAALGHLERLFMSADAEAIRLAMPGMQLDADGREAAIAMLDQFARRHDHASAWHVLGMLALRSGEIEIAHDASARVRALDPDWPLGIVLDARVKAASGEQAEAVALLEDAVDSHPDDASLRFALSGMLLATGDEPAARRHLETIIAREPGFTDAQWTMGLLRLRDGDPHGAEAHFRTMLGERDDAAFYIGTAHEMRDDWEGALEWYGKVTQGDVYLNARVKAAHMLFNLDRVEEARATLSDLRKSSPGDHAELYRVEAEMSMRTGRDAIALEVHDNALSEFPDDADMRYSRALLRVRTDDIEGAVSDLRHLHEAMPESAVVKNALGYVLADRGRPRDWQEARELIDRALEHDPDNPAYIDSKGWVLYRLGDLDGAREWLARAWDKMPDAEIGAHFGEVLWKLGDELAAKEVWMEAAMHDPDHRVLADTLERLLP